MIDREVRIGDVDYEVPALNYATVQRVQCLERRLQSTNDEAEKIDIMLDVIRALLPNYPNLTKEKLSESVTLKNCDVIGTALVRVAGLRMMNRSSN